MGVYIKDASGKRIKVAGGGSGAAGPSGQDGKSAYDYAVAGGYTGTEAEFQALMGSAPWVPEAGYIPASNPNLLDNWYFPDPINQRGIQSGVTWGSQVYGLDRWKSRDANTVKWIQGEGVYLLDGTWVWLEQSIEASRFYGKREITFSALVGTTLASITVDPEIQNSIEFFANDVRYTLSCIAPTDGIKQFRINRTRGYSGDGAPIIAAKVELGDKQTLARKDAAGNWILADPPPNKATELAKCQRYQVGIGYMVVSGFLTTSKGQLRFQIPTMAQMRATPTITDLTISGVRTTSGSNLAPEITDYFVASVSSSGLIVAVNTPTFSTDAYANNTPIGCYIQSAFFDANL